MSFWNVSRVTVSGLRFPAAGTIRILQTEILPSPSLTFLKPGQRKENYCKFSFIDFYAGSIWITDIWIDLMNNGHFQEDCYSDSMIMYDEYIKIGISGNLNSALVSVNQILDLFFYKILSLFTSVKFYIISQSVPLLLPRTLAIFWFSKIEQLLFSNLPLHVLLFPFIYIFIRKSITFMIDVMKSCII